MPYQIDVDAAGAAMLDRLVELGVLDVDLSDVGVMSALMPDSVAPDVVARALGVGEGELSVSPAVSRDEGSIWILRPRPISVGRLRIVPADTEVDPGALKLIDGPAFGTGLHPTTRLCLEALDDAVQQNVPEAMLDVGTGSGVIALGALTLGVPRALGIDVDADALRVAAENARVNKVVERLELACGGPEAVSGAFPLVFANILVAPLVEMAPALVRRLGHHGVLVLSGIPASVEPDVVRAYRHSGLRLIETKSHAGWVALVFRASW